MVSNPSSTTSWTSTFTIRVSVDGEEMRFFLSRISIGISHCSFASILVGLSVEIMTPLKTRVLHVQSLRFRRLLNITPFGILYISLILLEFLCVCVRAYHHFLSIRNLKCPEWIEKVRWKLTRELYFFLSRYGPNLALFSVFLLKEVKGGGGGRSTRCDVDHDYYGGKMLLGYFLWSLWESFAEDPFQ